MGYHNNNTLLTFSFVFKQREAEVISSTEQLISEYQEIMGGLSRLVSKTIPVFLFKHDDSDMKHAVLAKLLIVYEMPRQGRVWSDFCYIGARYNGTVFETDRVWQLCAYYLW